MPTSEAETEERRRLVRSRTKLAEKNAHYTNVLRELKTISASLLAFAVRLEERIETDLNAAEKNVLERGKPKTHAVHIDR